MESGFCWNRLHACCCIRTPRAKAPPLGVPVNRANVDPHDAINDFNAALKAARTISTLDEEDIKSLFIQALDRALYEPVVARLLLHDQWARAHDDLLTIQQWVRECYAAHVKAGTVPDTGFASAARFHGKHFMEKDADAARLGVRVLATVDPHEDAISDFNAAVKAARAGSTLDDEDVKSIFIQALAGQAYSFSSEEAENSVIVTRFQRAIDESNAEEFDALCVIAGGKPDIVADISACSFCADDGECRVSAVDEYADIARHADTAVIDINTFTADMPVVSAAAKPSPAASVSSGGKWTGPPDSHPFMPPTVTRTFADFIGSTGFTVEAPDPEPYMNMNMLSAVDQPAGSNGYATEDTSDRFKGKYGITH
ncbi:hypothetical protein CYMTET_18795 [Cymbomonas tetramitiformis]|uniref:Uncharacterized protein n=1 Tax=Cymbomonas tetramitiformis TaxID=36881 RepID=A0AAE0G7W2_9CHLO|nr:hypothetical protein CYMTET_18795 [Cymbomonas tetramitiformis]